MIGKVKVSREVAEEIERIRTLYEDDKEYLILSAATGFLSRNYKTLKHLKGYEVAEIFISGHEIEKTPAELLEDFEEYNTSADWNRDYVNGVCKTIKFFKENFEIKGIND